MPTFSYFGFYSRAAGSLAAFEEHGYAYEANVMTPEAWGAYKEKGICPFGQLPILETDDVGVVAQSVAIMQYIGKLKNAEGKDLKEKMRHEMVIGITEDLMGDLGKNVDTAFQKNKVPAEDLAKFWAETIPGRFAHYEKFIDGKDRFTEAGNTVGELYFCTVLHQIKGLVGDSLDKFPNLLSFYNRVSSLDSVKKVNAGETAFGKLNNYFVTSA